MLKILFRLGLSVYGGGNAITPIMQKELVQNNIITAGDFKEIVIVANTTPGTMQAKLALGAGQHNGDSKKAVASSYVISLPSFILMILFLTIFSGLAQEILKQICFMSYGISSVIVVLLLSFVLDVSRQNKYNKYIIFVVALFTSLKSIESLLKLYTASKIVSKVNILTVQPIIIILLTIFISAMISLKRGKWRVDKNTSRPKVDFKKPLKIIALLASLCIGMIVICSFFVKDVLWYIALLFISVISSFGGGSAYIASAQAFFVDTGYVHKDFFYNILLPINYALPGPTLTKISCGLGYGIGLDQGGMLVGVLMSILFLTIGIFASCFVFTICSYLYKNYNDADIFITLKKYVLPVVCGTLISIIISIYVNMIKIVKDNHISIASGTVLAFVFFLICLTLRKKYNAKDGNLIFIFAILSEIVLNMR